VARFAVGVFLGAMLTVCPVYIAEARTCHRNRVLTLPSHNIYLCYYARLPVPPLGVNVWACWF
jgi:hypothetical protein